MLYLLWRRGRGEQRGRSGGGESFNAAKRATDGPTSFVGKVPAGTVTWRPYNRRSVTGAALSWRSFPCVVLFSSFFDSCSCAVFLYMGWCVSVWRGRQRRAQARVKAVNPALDISIHTWAESQEKEKKRLWFSCNFVGWVVGCSSTFTNIIYICVCFGQAGGIYIGAERERVFIFPLEGESVCVCLFVAWTSIHQRAAKPRAERIANILFFSVRNGVHP